MVIYRIESNFGHYRGKRGTSPLMYWEIGKELVEFAKRRKKDHDKFKDRDRGISQNRIINEVVDLLREIAIQPDEEIDDLDLEEIAENEGFNDSAIIKKKINFSATDFAKRSLTRCARLYEMISNKEKIDPEISWTIYAEFAEQYGQLKDIPSEAKYILLENLIKLRKKMDLKFTHLVARVYIYEFIRLVNATTKIRSNIISLKYMIEDNLEDIKGAGKKVRDWYLNEYLKDPINFEI